jgi:hypothetical protein
VAEIARRCNFARASFGHARSGVTCAPFDGMGARMKAIWLMTLLLCACAATPEHAIVEIAPKPTDSFDVEVKGELATACGLRLSRYYDAKTDAVARLAACLTTGALQGAHVKISGTSDSRPRRVARTLGQRGVPEAQMTIIRRGTLTSGLSETKIDKENERRVEIELGE